MEKECQFLFTYGTLMSRFENEYSRLLHKSAILVGEGMMAGRLYRIDWYPGAIFEPFSIENVYGEVYKLQSSSAMFLLLDEYEDIIQDISKSLYRRIMVPITMVSGEIVNSWAYVYNQPTTDLDEIISGRF